MVEIFVVFGANDSYLVCGVVGGLVL